jgi:glyoxylase-like metal-dependent hydrolase (beta-lactamase superfamily II)
VAIRVTPQGLIVVDDKYEENAAEVLARIQKISRAPIRFLLNTHHHTDHAGGDALFVKTTDSSIACWSSTSTSSSPATAPCSPRSGSGRIGRS